MVEDKKSVSDLGLFEFLDDSPLVCDLSNCGSEATYSGNWVSSCEHSGVRLYCAPDAEYKFEEFIAKASVHGRSTCLACAKSDILTLWEDLIITKL